jgi:very-short-patch-repair endonuclease
MPDPINKKARRLRQDMTDAERTLWYHLKDRKLCGCKFRRQVPMGGYIVDFVCRERGLEVEVDGGQHAEQREKDGLRTRWIEGKGYRVLRFWNNEVLGNAEGVLIRIAEFLGEGTPHPNPLPKGERGRRERGLLPRGEETARPRLSRP